MTTALDGKVAIVTGAGRGIGAAIADALAAAGARVVGFDLAFDTDAADDRTWDAVELDITDRVATSARLQVVAERHGRIDVVVNNAAINRRADIDGLPESTWDAVQGVNLRAPILLIRDALPHLTSGASVVNISSIRAQRGFVGDVSYLAAKGGIEAATRGIAVELAPRGIRVNCVAPGAIETELNRAILSDDAHRARTTARIPLGRLGRPDDIAGAVVFLASDAASYITGTVVTVDGGMTAMG